MAWTCDKCGMTFTVDGYRYVHEGSKVCQKRQEERRKSELLKQMAGGRNG